MDNPLPPPVLSIPYRKVVAVEHPMIIHNIDNGLKTFGNHRPFQRVLHDHDSEGSIPLYLRHNDPMCVPILSHNAPSSNVLVKITVPKRIGKRKRGSQDAFQPVDVSARDPTSAQLSKALKDNPEQYKVEAVAEIENTHRFKGMADFHHSTNGAFTTKVRDFILPGQVEKMRQFKFDPSRSPNKNEEFMPPPALTNMTLPFNWGWHQNPQVQMGVDETTGEVTLSHYEKRPKKPKLQYLQAKEEVIPQSSSFKLPEDRATLDVIARVAEALNERPVWTRRALGNRVGHKLLPVPILDALPYLAYQFKGGPFRDAVIKYGVDPRKDPEYRTYQTVFFKIHEETGKASLTEWKDSRTNVPLSKNAVREDPKTHLFDGKTLALDGKVWQLCDVTDPLLFGIIHNASIRETFDTQSDGFFNNGSWAKIHGIMKFKIIAMRNKIELPDTDLEEAANIPDIVENNGKGSRQIVLPVPEALSDKKHSELGPDAQRMQEGIVRQTGERKHRKRSRLRHLRLDKTLINEPKRQYVRTKPIPPQSRKGTTARWKKKVVEPSAADADAPHLLGRVIGKSRKSKYTRREKQPESINTGQQTMDENNTSQFDDGAPIEDDEGEENGNDDDDESDEESGHDEDADRGEDDSPDEEEYGSDNTDEVDVAAQGPLPFQPQSGS